MRNKVKWNLNKFRPVRPWDNKFFSKNVKKKIDLRHNLYLPFVLFFLLLKKFGLKLRRYPDHFGHQNFDIEYFLREEIKEFGINIFFLGISVPNNFLLKKHKKLIIIVKTPKWLLKKLFTIEKVSKIKFRKSIFNGPEYVYKKIDIVKKKWFD